jgi:hypothetical protein
MTSAMIRPSSFAFAALLAAAVPARAWGAPMPPEVEAAVDRAAARGLPTELLMAKAAEGLAKGVAPARVATVLDDLAGGMAAAQAVLGGGAQTGEVLAAAAAASRNGASAASISRLGRLPQPARAPALRTFGDLLGHRFPEDGAIRVVEVAARADQPPVALAALSVQAAQLVRGNVSPEGALGQISASQAASGGAAWGAGGKAGKDPPGKGLDNAPGQQKK